MVTQFLSQGPQSKPSKRICPKKVKKLEIMVNYNDRAQLWVKGIPFISFLWTDGDSDSNAATGELTVATAPFCALYQSEEA